MGRCVVTVVLHTSMLCSMLRSMGTSGRMLEQSGADCPTTRAVNELPGTSGVAQVPVRPVLIKENHIYHTAPVQKWTRGERQFCRGYTVLSGLLDCENILCNLASRTLTPEFQSKRAKSNP